MSTADKIRHALERLAPTSVEIEDQSAHHVGHAGAAGGGGHYGLLIVAACFRGKTRIERHRLIYDALGPMMRREIHALTIRAHTPDEL